MANLNKHIKSDTVKWVIVFVLLVAVIGSVIALAITVTSWADRDAKPVEEVVEQDAQSGPLEFTETQSSPYISLATVRAGAEPTASSSSSDSYTVKATIKDNADQVLDDYQKANFSLTYNDDSADTDISQYIRLDHETNSCTAKLTCLKAFSKPIWLVCASVITPSAKASIKLDYAKRFTGAATLTKARQSSNFKISTNAGVVTVSDCKYAYDSDQLSFDFVSSLNFGEGTVNDVMGSSTPDHPNSGGVVYIAPTASLKKEYLSQVKSLSGGAEVFETVTTLLVNSYNFSLFTLEDLNFGTMADFTNSLIYNYRNGYDMNSVLLPALFKAMSICDVDFEVSMYINFKHQVMETDYSVPKDGGIEEETLLLYELNFDSKVSAVELDTESVIF